MAPRMVNCWDWFRRGVGSVCCVSLVFSTNTCQVDVGLLKRSQLTIHKHRRLAQQRQQPIHLQRRLPVRIVQSAVDAVRRAADHGRQRRRRGLLPLQRREPRPLALLQVERLVPDLVEPAQRRVPAEVELDEARGLVVDGRDGRETRLGLLDQRAQLLVQVRGRRVRARLHQAVRREQVQHGLDLARRVRARVADEREAVLFGFVDRAVAVSL
ncbi:hypothetical protein VTN02DRAFT_6257 [Thermoascus thermophilus]